MIVISRRQTEGIVIHGEIVVTVLGVNDDEVQLGIEGPDEMSIESGEPYAESEEESHLAALTH